MKSHPPGAGQEVEARLRQTIDALANQLCKAVDGDFDFAVHADVEDETVEKLSMLINFVLDSARRGMGALRDHNRALAEVDQAKTAFFSNVSHEFRTPLTLMLGPLEEALSGSLGELSAPLREQLEVTHRNSLRLLKLVNTLLDFSRIEAGRMTATFEPTDLGLVTAELASLFRSAVERAGLELVVDGPSEPVIVHLDRQLWERVILNLVSNAFKFTFEGRITVSVRRTDGGAEVSVEDTGVGIAAEHLPHVFGRFHRIAGTRARSHEGSGIGLALVRELVQLHGGTISVESRPGEGTRFRVRLRDGTAHLPPGSVREGAGTAPGSAPATTAFVAEALQWAGGDVASPGSGASSQRVLVVDDNADVRNYLSRLLGGHWNVETARDGQEALAVIRSRPPDLVVSDVMMPGMDGLELVRRIRSDASCASLPVLLLSARAGEESRVEGLAAGADDYVPKPFSAKELIARVSSHLALARARQEVTEERTQLLESERAARRAAETESRINEALYRIGSAFSNELDQEKLLQLITDEATSLIGAEFGAFFFNAYTKERGAYTLFTISGAKKDAFAGFPIPRVTPLFAPTFRGEGVIRADDVRKDPRYGAMGRQPSGHVKVVSYLAVPVVGIDREVFGALFFGHQEAARFTEAHERMVTGIAVQAANALDKARLYRELRKKEERAREAFEMAREADRRKDEFLAMLGHELRNPLAPILTATQLLGLRADASSRREREIIERQVHHLMRLVDDLLDISRITRGKVELSRVPIEIATVVRKAVEMAGPLLERRAHALEIDVAPDLWVNGDSVRLAQVIANLLTNAAKYTPPKGHVRVACRRENGSVTISVRDDGRGISPDLMPRIFEMFVQDARSPDRSDGGLGIGLTLVKSLTELHDGTVSAASEGPGRGSEFVVRLPAIEPPRTEGQPPNVGRAGARGRGVRVLVVDDNQDAAQMLGEALRLAGHAVTVAFDGPSALRALDGNLPEVALLDIGLPVMDGYELAERVTARCASAPPFLVALTGYGQDADRDRSRMAGFHQHLTKPVSLEKLLQVIEENVAPRPGM